MSPQTRTDAPPTLSRPARIAITIAWSSFLAAALATMFCFAFIDPNALADGNPPQWWGPRMHVYALGFFFFWVVGAVAATISWSLANARRRP
jgi:hypothetical protein